MARGARGEQRGGQRRLARAGFARDDDPAPLLHERPEERRGRRRQRVARDEVVERDVAHGVAPDRRREPVGDGRDRGGQPRGAVEHARLHHRVLGVELAFGVGEEPVEDLSRFSSSVVGSARPRNRPAGVEIRDAGALDEDLLHVLARQQLAERAELGDRTQHPLHHRLGVAERELLAEAGAPLVVVDRPLDLGPDLGELALGLQPASLDPGDRVAPDHVVRVGARRRPLVHDASSRRATAARRGNSATAAASCSTARVKRPRATGRPVPCRVRDAPVETDEPDVDRVGARRDLVVQLTAPERRSRRAIRDDDERRRRGQQPGVDDPREQPGDADRTRVAHRDDHVGFAHERLRGREPAARRTAEIVQRPGAVGDDGLEVVAESLDHAEHFARTHLRPTRRVGETADDGELRTRIDHARMTRDRRARAPPRRSRSGGWARAAGRAAARPLARRRRSRRARRRPRRARRDGELDRDLGPADAGRPTDRDSRPERGVGATVPIRAIGPSCDLSAANARTNASGPASDSIDGVDTDGREMGAARRFGEIVDAEHAATAGMDVAHEGTRQRRPPVTHDEHVVRLLERDALLDDEAPHARAAVIGEIADAAPRPRGRR